MKMGIDPVTHKPVSQVLSDYGTISGLPSTENQTSFVNKEDLMSNMSMVEHTEEDQAHSWEHQVQYQVMNPENVQPHVFSEAASSSSSSSSSNLTQLCSPPQSYSCQTSQTQIIAPPCSSFDWSEFLQCDPFVWSEFQQLQQCELEKVMSSLSSTGQIENGVEPSNNVNSNSNGQDKQGAAGEGYGAVACEGHSSSGNSFVDGILDRDSEIRAAFPELLDASFDY